MIVDLHLLTVNLYLLPWFSFLCLFIEFFKIRVICFLSMTILNIFDIPLDLYKMIDEM